MPKRTTGEQRRVALHLNVLSMIAIDRVVPRSQSRREPSIFVIRGERAGKEHSWFENISHMYEQEYIISCLYMSNAMIVKQNILVSIRY
jgi:hypothetical protein